MSKDDAVKALLALCQAKGIKEESYDRIQIVGPSGERVDLKVYYCGVCHAWVWVFDADPLPYHCGLPTGGVDAFSMVKVTAKWGELTRDIMEAARS